MGPGGTEATQVPALPEALLVYMEPLRNWQEDNLEPAAHKGTWLHRQELHHL